jgi:tetratricopeptide repeat protein
VRPARRVSRLVVVALIGILAAGGWAQESRPGSPEIDLQTRGIAVTTTMDGGYFLSDFWWWFDGLYPLYEKVGYPVNPGGVFDWSVGTTASATLWFPSAQWLGIHIGARYAYLPILRGNVTISQTTPFAGVSLTFPVGARGHWGIVGRGGLDISVINNAYLLEEYQEFTETWYDWTLVTDTTIDPVADESSTISARTFEWAVGMTGSIQLGRSLGLQAELGYRKLRGMAGGPYATIGSSFHVAALRTRTERLQGLMETMPTPLSTLAVSEVSLDDVFPVFYSYYRDHPVGTARITNSGSDTISDIAVTLIQEEYMGNPTHADAPATLAPGETGVVTLYALFTDDVLALSEGTTVSGRLQIESTSLGQAHINEQVISIDILNRNAITWTDDRKAAAFVTARDDEVLTFSRNAIAAVEALAPSSIDQNLLKAAAIHEALRLYDISYTVDPGSAYETLSSDATALDFMQFPRQTLRFKAGDCDDLTVLYCALLESVGVPTAFLTTPGHIYMAVALEVTPEEATGRFSRPEDLIVHDGRVWLPIEVTLVDSDFLEAWRYGAREWREYANSGAGLYVTQAAWQEYRAVGFSEPVQIPAMPQSAAILSSLRQGVAEFAKTELYAPVEELRDRLVQSDNPQPILTRIAGLYAGFGLYDEAAAELEAALEYGPYWPATVNLGTIAFTNGDYAAAQEYFEAGYALRPTNPLILLSLARTHHAIENYGLVTRYYEQLASVAPSLAEEYDYLSLRGDEGQRAARANTKLEWIDGEAE